MASLLEDAKPMIESDPKADFDVWSVLYSKQEQDLNSLETYRYGWWQHWARLAEFILPRRYHWLVIANRTDRGLPINQNIIDATGTIAARVLANGLVSGLTSPSSPWFRMEVPDANAMAQRDVKIWLDEVQSKMATAMQHSNFYDAIGTMQFDNVVFGTAPVIIYEDYDTIFRCYNPCAGEYYLAASAELRIERLKRKFTFTKRQVVEMFGDGVDASIVEAAKAGGGQGNVEIVVAHSIEPNTPIEDEAGNEVYPVPKHFLYREIYWQWGGGNGKRPFAMRGFHECPFIAPRWDVVSNDAYGRSPCMDALPDIMQLQEETKRKAEGILKQVRPPMMADISLKNEPTATTPGGMTYVANLGSNPGMKPVFEVRPDLTAMMNDLKEIQGRIQRILFNDLFMMISQLDTVRSATEIQERKQEKLIQIGPVIERLQGEGFDMAIDRIFNIMLRKGMFSPPPPSIRGMPLKVLYISPLAELQRSAGTTTSIERTFQLAGQLAGVAPDIMDNLDLGEGLREYADALRTPPKIVRDAGAVLKIQAARAKKQEQAELLQQTVAGAKGAKDLSDAQVGGGQNALQAMLNGGAGGAR